MLSHAVLPYIKLAYDLSSLDPRMLVLKLSPKISILGQAAHLTLTEKGRIRQNSSPAPEKQKQQINQSMPPKTMYFIK